MGARCSVDDRSRSGDAYGWTSAGTPMVHRWECPGPPIVTGGIPQILGTCIISLQFTELKENTMIF